MRPVVFVGVAVDWLGGVAADECEEVPVMGAEGFDVPGSSRAFGPDFVAPDAFDVTPAVASAGDGGRDKSGRARRRLSRNEYRRQVVESIAADSGLSPRSEVKRGAARDVDAFLSSRPPSVRARLSVRDARHVYAIFRCSVAEAVAVAVAAAERRRGNAPVSREGVAGDFGE